MCILIVRLPHRYAAIPIIAMACYMTLGQMIMIGDISFYFLRLVALLGLIRVIARKEIQLINFNSIDKIFILWVISNFSAYVIREQNIIAITNRLGFAYDVIGIYFLFRVFIRNIEDRRYIINSIAIIIVPVAIAMLFESISGKNLYSILGGVPEISMVRDGRIRCQGPFLHPILAGTFGATILSLLLGQFFSNKKNKYIAAIGIICATIITITATSGGAATVYLFGILGISMWFMRKHMRVIRWSILIAIIGLHMFMKAPVWYLIARLGSITGGSSYHRAEIIDAAVKHFNEWWLLGTSFTAHWMPSTLTLYKDKADITNMFIGQGVQGGLLTMFLFIGIIVFCFRSIGCSLQTPECKPFTYNFFLWSLGATLFAHIAAFFSVAYNDQSSIFYYMLIAMIAGTNELLHSPQEKEIKVALE